MGSFKSILSVICSVLYCVRDTQGIPNSAGHSHVLFMHCSLLLLSLGRKQAAQYRWCDQRRDKVHGCAAENYAALTKP